MHWFPAIVSGDWHFGLVMNVMQFSCAQAPERRRQKATQTMRKRFPTIAVTRLTTVQTYEPRLLLRILPDTMKHEPELLGYYVYRHIYMLSAESDHIPTEKRPPKRRKFYSNCMGIGDPA